MTGQETLKVLLDTHFPDSKVVDSCPEECGQSDLEPYRVNRENWDLLQRKVNQTKLRWAINYFDPFKLAGPDLIISAFLQQGIDVCSMFRVSLALGYIPTAWRKARVTFIPQPGKPSYTEVKAYRPICLSSFLLTGILGKMCWEEILYTITNMPINPANQLIQR